MNTVKDRINESRGAPSTAPFWPSSEVAAVQSLSVTTLKPFSNAVRIVDSTQQLVSSPPSTLVHLCVCVYMHTQSTHTLKHTQMQTQTKTHRHSTHTQTHTHTTVLMPFLRSWASRSVPGKASSPRLPLITMSPSCGSIPVCVFVRLCVCVPCVCTSVCACVHVCVCACVHVHTYTCMHACNKVGVPGPTGEKGVVVAALEDTEALVRIVRSYPCMHTCTCI